MLNFSRLVFSENTFIIGQLNKRCEEKSIGVSGRNLISEKGILFIHNPKVAGNSLTKILTGTNHKLNTSHKTPTLLVTPKTWEENKTVVAIRHPIDRLISSFHYHTKPEYQGVFCKRYADLPNFSLEKYFSVFSKIPYVIMPQWHYTRHFLSKKPVDFLLRFENLETDVEEMAKKLNLKFEGLPHLNSSKRAKQEYFNSKSFRNKVYSYYKKDFITFGYQPNFESY